MVYKREQAGRNLSDSAASQAAVHAFSLISAFPAGTPEKSPFEVNEVNNPRKH